MRNRRKKNAFFNVFFFFQLSLFWEAILEMKIFHPLFFSFLSSNYPTKTASTHVTWREEPASLLKYSNGREKKKTREQEQSDTIPERLARLDTK